MWACGLDSLVVYFNVKNPWYMGGRRDNKEWDLHWENLLPRVSGYKRSDIKEANITESRVYLLSFNDPKYTLTLKLESIKGVTRIYIEWCGKYELFML